MKAQHRLREVRKKVKELPHGPKVVAVKQEVNILENHLVIDCSDSDKRLTCLEEDMKLVKEQNRIIMEEQFQE